MTLGPSVPAACAAALHRAVPQLAAQRVTLLQDGAEKTVLLVAGRYVARFPKDAAAAASLARERALLSRLSGRLSLATPRIELTTDAFDLYERLPGDWLTHDRWLALSPGDQRTVAAQVGRFMAELHAAVTPDPARALGFAAPTWPLPRETVAATLLPRLADPALRRFVEDVHSLDVALGPVIPSQLRLLHGDLGGHNVAFDPASRRLVGVYDFSDACLGELTQDFQYLPAYAWLAAEVAAEAYVQAGGPAPDPHRVLVRHATNTLSHVAYAALHQPEAAFTAKVDWIRHTRELFRSGRRSRL